MASAKNKRTSIFENMGVSDMSYLADPSTIDALNDAKAPASVNEKTSLPLADIVPFKNHPFHVETEGEEFEKLVESVQENGIINPLLVRPMGDKYELVSGHRRLAAAKEAALTEVPVTIREMDDYIATIVMVDSNIYREKILPSEKAKAYRMCFDAKKHQGKKGGDTASLIAGEDTSKRQVQRYVRLSYLSDALLNYVDEGKIAINSGLELSYLDEEAQDILFEQIETLEKCPSMEEAHSLREKFEENEELSKEAVFAILIGDDIKKTKPKTSISFKVNEIKSYFPDDTDPEEMIEKIKQLLIKYQDEL